MPEIKRLFNASKMNRDLDDKMLKPGEYREALNINVSKSESSDIGAVENILGNKLIVDTSLSGAKVIGQPPQQQSLLMHLFINWFPMFLLIAVWVFFMRQMQGGGGGRGAMSFGRSRARLLG